MKYPKSKTVYIAGLLESTVNGIANTVFPYSRYGGPKTEWNYDDRWVYSIEASKQITADTCGVEIVIEKPPSVEAQY